MTYVSVTRESFVRATIVLSSQAFVSGEPRPGPPSGAADTAPTPHASPTIRMLILIALYSVPAATVLRPLDEFDTWWHLRTGQWIVEHHAVPATDLFATVLAGKPWIAYSWLFEVQLHGLHTLFGLGGVVLYRLLATLLLVAVLHRFISRREPRFIVAVGLVAIALAALAPLLCERPWLFSIIFCTLTLDAILDLRLGRATWITWVLPVWFALWANLHIQFVFGLLVLGLACAGPVLDRLLGRAQPADHANTAGSREWWQLVALTVGCFLATLLNPYGLRIYGEVFDLGSHSSFRALVGEMRSLGFRSLWDWAVLGLFAGAVFTLGRRSPLGSFEGLLLLASAYVSFSCRRDLWLVVLASLTVILATPRSSAALVDTFVLTPRRAVVVGLGVGLVLVAFCLLRDCSEQRLAREVAAEFPAEAAAFVEQQGYPGPLYNQADWGSYLLWRLPRHPVAIDGRMHLYGDERAFRFQRTGEGRPGWENDPELTSAQLVILRAQAPLAELLARDPRFQLVHRDPVAVVFIARQ